MWTVKLGEIAERDRELGQIGYGYKPGQWVLKWVGQRQEGKRVDQ